jgi:hypothetical protein
MYSSRLPLSKADGALGSIVDAVTSVHSAGQFCMHTILGVDVSYHPNPTIRLGGDRGYLGIPFSALQLAGLKPATQQASSSLWTIAADGVSLESHGEASCCQVGPAGHGAAS